jgi:transketolase
LAEAKGEKPSVKLGEGYRVGEMVATREAYGQALVKLGVEHPEVVVLDAEVGNSTHAGEFKKYFPKRFWEMYIAEQNMIGAAVGLAARGEVPFASSFSAFLSRAADQLRMAGYSGANVKICGSHAGVEIGEDGPSQMGLEDLAIFRSIWGSVVVCPADAVSCEKLMGEVFGHRGLAYVRTARMKIPVIYGEEEGFKIGGAKVLRESREDAVAVLGAGVTVHEAIKAFEILSEKGVKIRVIDVYSIKPLDVETLIRVVRETKAVVTVEDHYAQGGMGEAVVAALAEAEVLVPVHSLAIRKLPRSGKPEELMDDEGISARRIVEKVVEVLNTKA